MDRRRKSVVLILTQREPTIHSGLSFPLTATSTLCIFIHITFILVNFISFTKAKMLSLPVAPPAPSVENEARMELVRLLPSGFNVYRKGTANIKGKENFREIFVIDV